MRAQELGQPLTCRVIGPGRLFSMSASRRSSSWMAPVAVSLVSTIASLQNSMPVHAMVERRKREGRGGRPRPSRAGRGGGTRHGRTNRARSLLAGGGAEGGGGGGEAELNECGKEGVNPVGGNVKDDKLLVRGCSQAGGAVGFEQGRELDPQGAGHPAHERGATPR